MIIANYPSIIPEWRFMPQNRSLHHFLHVPGFVLKSVQNNFTVNTDGTRSFQTIIQFVRGILVNENKQLIGEGRIDTLASSLAKSDSINNMTMVAAQNSVDPKK